MTAGRWLGMSKIRQVQEEPKGEECSISFILNTEQPMTRTTLPTQMHVSMHEQDLWVLGTSQDSVMLPIYLGYRNTACRLVHTIL